MKVQYYLYILMSGLETHLFEIVVWMPLVDCSKTKSMFILPYKDNSYYYKNFKKYKNSEKSF